MILGGSGFESDAPEAKDMLSFGKARASVLRAVRARCEADKFDLEVVGLKKPDPTGANFLTRLNLAEDQLELGFQLGRGADAPSFRAVSKWRPIDQRSLLPPLVAIFLAILFRRPVASLFAGVWAGAALLHALGGMEFLPSIGQGLRSSFDTFIYGQLKNQGRRHIVLFVVFMLAMVGVMIRSGGIRGVMERLAKLAKDARSTQIATWFMGLAIFFDDYANSILVGSTMRPLTDRFKVAREKLAFIVDSTAAPVAGISILSTWIAFEVSTFSPSLPDAELATNQGYAIFLQTLPYRFYCIFTLIFVGMVVFSGRDFGPMLKAERRARKGELLRPGATPMVGEAATRLEAAEGVRISAASALVPLALFIGTVIGMILHDGGAWAMGSQFFTIEGVSRVLSDGSGEVPLMWGAIVGFVVAVIYALGNRLSLGKALLASLDSLRSMGVALVILYLAWSLGQVCIELGTATFLSVTLGDSLPWMILPIVLFVLSGVIAFSTGSSWSTMTILLPLVIG